MIYLVVKCDFCKELHAFNTPQIYPSAWQETILVLKQFPDDTAAHINLPDGWSYGIGGIDDKNVRCPKHTEEYNRSHS